MKIGMRSFFSLILLILTAVVTAACSTQKYRTDDPRVFKKVGLKPFQSKSDPSGLIDLMTGEIVEKIEAPSEVIMLLRPLAKFDPRILKLSKPLHFRVHTAYFDEELKRAWVGGALYSKNSIYRSLLLYSDGGGKWQEAEPANQGVTFLFAEKGPTNEFVVVESSYTEGNALYAFWNFNSVTGSWSEKRILRTGKSGDSFKKGIGCCSEIILDLGLSEKKWTLNLAGTERSATFVTKDQGRTWRIQGKPGSFSLAKDRGIRQWMASPVDFADEPENSMILIEFANRDKPYQLPRYWNYQISGGSVRLKPLIK
jgi:hypothetical protein